MVSGSIRAAGVVSTCVDIYSTVQAPPLPAPGKPTEQRGQLARLLGAEMLEEQPADAADVGAARVAELGQALVGELCVRHPSIVRAGGSLDEAAGDQPVDEAGDPGPGEHGALGQRGHGQLPVGRLGQVQQDLVVARGDAVFGGELGVEQPQDRGVTLQIAAPSLERVSLEAGGVGELELGPDLHGCSPHIHSFSGNCS